jgi:hypothetical protein
MRFLIIFLLLLSCNPFTEEHGTCSELYYVEVINGKAYSNILTDVSYWKFNNGVLSGTFTNGENFKYVGIDLAKCIDNWIL